MKQRANRGGMQAASSWSSANGNHLGLSALEKRLLAARLPSRLVALLHEVAQLLERRARAERHSRS